MANKTRLDKLEQAARPNQKKNFVFWEDPDQEGVFYDRPWHEPNRKRISKEDFDRLAAEDPNNVLVVVYRKHWHKPGQDLAEI